MTALTTAQMNRIALLAFQWMDRNDAGNYASLDEAIEGLFVPSLQESLKEFYMSHGFDGSAINIAVVRHALFLFGVCSRKGLDRSQHGLAAMERILIAYSQGMYSLGEALRAVQLSPMQLKALQVASDLPPDFVTLAQLDRWVAISEDAGFWCTIEHPLTNSASPK